MIYDISVCPFMAIRVRKILTVRCQGLLAALFPILIFQIILEKSDRPHMPYLCFFFFHLLIGIGSVEMAQGFQCRDLIVLSYTHCDIRHLAW